VAHDATVPVEIAFDLALEHGRCVGVRIPADPDELLALAASTLPPDERAAALELAALRRRSWIGGRVALREALARAGLEAPAVLRDDRGAPMFPAHVVGSVTHKAEVAAALVAPAPPTGARVGVDLEVEGPRGTDISSKVLTDDELAEIANLEGDERAREVLLRFSLKESIYKAIDPFVRRYVGFREVTARPRAGGGVDVTAGLRAGEGPFAIDATWRRLDGLVVTTARAAILR
jgi:4'-phosphopantetheinyl transferase EntD